MAAEDSRGARQTPVIGFVGALWGLIGVTLIVGSAVWRLSPYAADAFSYQWTPWHWALFIGFTAFMAYGEGYKGFQKAFSPRVVARARYLQSNPTSTRLFLAPLFCMGFFGATKKRKIVSWCLFTGIVILIILVRQLSQPWRGIIDFGVVLGLSWGLIALWVFAGIAYSGRGFDRDPEVS